MNRFFTIALAIGILASCKKDPKPNPQPDAKFGSGVMILNEGAFMTGTGTVDFYNRESKSVSNDIFTTENSLPLGNILQSATQVGNDIYFVVNNSQRIVVADANTMKQKGVVSGFQSPRYLISTNNSKAFVSDWISDEVHLVDLSTNTITSSTKVGVGPNRMLLLGNNLYVLNSGGFGVDSTISILNAANGQMISTKTVGHNPQGIQVDVLGNLWVLCMGINDWSNPSNNTPGTLLQINSQDFSVVQAFTFPAGMHPGNLEINATGTLLYFLGDAYGGSVYQMSVNSTSLPTTPISTGFYYGLGVDFVSGDVYATDPLDYVQPGLVYRLNANGTPLDTIDAGIIPSGFLFR